MIGKLVHFAEDMTTKKTEVLQERTAVRPRSATVSRFKEKLGLVNSMIFFLCL